MAAGMFDKPGSEHGPCEGECNHVDCTETRRMTSQTCIRCGNPIGYETRFFEKGDGRLVHEDCEYEFIESAREGKEELKR